MKKISLLFFGIVIAAIPFTMIFLMAPGLDQTYTQESENQKINHEQPLKRGENINLSNLNSESDVDTSPENKSLLSSFTFSTQHLIELIIIIGIGLYAIYRVLTLFDKYKDFEKYISKRRLSLNPDMYRYFLKKEFGGVIYQIKRRESLNQKPSNNLDKYLSILGDEIKRLPPDDSKKRTYDTLIGRQLNLFETMLIELRLFFIF